MKRSRYLGSSDQGNCNGTHHNAKIVNLAKQLIRHKSHLPHMDCSRPRFEALRLERINTTKAQSGYVKQKSLIDIRPDASITFLARYFPTYSPPPQSGG